MRKRTKRGAFSFFLIAALLISLLAPAAAFADGAEEVVIPDGDGVTNPAASIELVDSTDSKFFLYSFDGDASILTFPSDFPYYDTSHTVYVKVTGEDPTQPCDDVLAFYSGNACDVMTVSQGQVEGEDDLWYCEMTMAGHDGPAEYTVVASSGVEMTYFPTAVTIISSISLNYTSYTLKVGRIVNLTASGLDSDGTTTWSSSDEEVATVSSSGVVTGVADGTADITVSYTNYGITLTATCAVTVGTGVKASSESETDTTDSETTEDVSGTTDGSSESDDTQTTDDSDSGSTGKSSSLKKGDTCTVGSGAKKATYKALSSGTVAYSKCKSTKKTATVPNKVKLSDGKTYTVTKVSAKAFASSKKVTTVTVKAKKLTKKTVKKSLSGSKVKTVKTIRYNSYKKFFTKANCGKSVKIKQI